MKKIYLRAALLLTAIATAWAVTASFLGVMRSYQGYCEKDSVKLTADERLNIAINHYLHQQRLTDLLEVGRMERASVGAKELGKIYTLIPYRSHAEFKRENSDCCKRTWGEVEGDQFDFWERSEGVGDGMFEFRHKIRYLDENGVAKVMISGRTYYMVSNCGYQRPRFYY
ncbi:hypothetical protein [Ralstonia pseudosolanacearum]|uniref:hypothetical protein n=1 Tax=Ralstonia pseudosolanacearum TaxID=1310165 RepID=UPI001FFC0E3E|nr:hypothetical protein [Ralstonia pseudosolanacearum]